MVAFGHEGEEKTALGRRAAAIRGVLRQGLVLAHLIIVYLCTFGLLLLADDSTGITHSSGAWKKCSNCPPDIALQSPRVFEL